MKIILKLRNEFAQEDEYKKYLSDMAVVATPDCHRDWENDTYTDICYEFTQLRNSAKTKLTELEGKLSKT